MTILAAATLSTCSVLVADSRQSNLTASTTAAVTKIRRLTTNLIAAKFGYAGPEGDAIWEQISALDPEVLGDVRSLLPRVRELGQPIYEERKDWGAASGFGDYGYTMVFASFDGLDGPGIHYIDWKLEDGLPVSLFTKDAGARVLAQGPAGSQQAAITGIQSAMQMVGDQPVVLVKRWAADVVQWAATVDPDLCALPADVCVVNASGIFGPTRITGRESDLDALTVPL